MWIILAMVGIIVGVTFCGYLIMRDVEETRLGRRGYVPRTGVEEGVTVTEERRICKFCMLPPFLDQSSMDENHVVDATVVLL